MKFIKYALIIFAVAVMTDVVITKAYASPTQVTIVQELDKNNKSWTAYKTKNTSTTQTYYNDKSYTWLTNPCPDCKVAVRVYNENGDVGVTRITTTGETKSLNEPTSLSAPGNYRLAIWRYNATALSTHHQGVWKIN